MIAFALILADIMLAAFAVMVASIRRSERRQSLFDRSQGGHPGAFTRIVLGVHVHQAQPSITRKHLAASNSQARR